jgi:AcrR family transcriptional regulator
MTKTVNRSDKARRPRNARRSTDEVRTLIVDAASRLFATRGYTQTTMRDVAADAGIALSVLYRQFASKELLFSATLVAPFLSSFERFRAEDAGGEGGAAGGKAVNAFVGDLFRNLTTHRRTIITLLGALEDPGAQLIEDVRTGLGDAWQSLQLSIPTGSPDDSIPVDRMRDANMLTVAMVVGLVLFQPWSAAAREDASDQTLTRLAAIFAAAGIDAVTGR